MSQLNRCPDCGTEWSPDSPAGACPKCLLKAGMDESVHKPGDDATFVTSRTEDKHCRNESGTDDHPSVAPAAGTFVRYFGEYELLEEVGRGGMGVVYRARQTRLNRIVALKMILAGQLASHADVQRFQKEAEAAAQLDHPGIVPIFEVGEHDGRHFYSMALVEGQSLAQRVAEAPLDPDVAAKLVRAVALAVHHAHETGVIHRDLKPANILIDREGQPRVADFGLAKHIAGTETQTVTGQILGTPGFMAPEQASGETGRTTPSVDVYALGAILYSALCGRPPHQADNALDTLKLVVDAEPVPPRQLNPRLPKDLETICLKCLRKMPARRYTTATELAEDLDRYLQRRPILARPAGSPEKTWRWCRRNPMVASLGLLSVLLLVAGTATASYLAVLANGQRMRSQDELYRNQIMLAERELESGHSYSAQQILAECPTDRRGWEWNYILRLSLISPSQTLTTDSALIASAQFSSTGDRLVSITQDGQLEILDGTTLQPLHECRVEDEEVADMKLSADGTRAFIGTKSQQFYANVDSGNIEWKRPAPYVSALSGDGSVAVAATTSDKSFEIDAFTPGTDEVLWSTEGVWDGPFRKLEFDDTGTKLRILNSRQAFIFDAKTGKQLAEMPLADYSMLQEPSPDSWYLTATGTGWEQSVMCASKGMFNTRVFVANMDKPYQNIELPLGPPHVYHSQLSPDGTVLAYAVSAFDVVDMIPDNLMDTTDSMQAFKETQLARNIPGGGSSSYLIRLYETRTGGLIHVLRGFTGNRLNGLAFDPTGTRLCAWGGETPSPWQNPQEGPSGEIRVWNIWRSKTATVLQGHSRGIRRVAVTSDNKHILSSSSDGAVCVWDADSGQLMRKFTAHQHDVRDERPLSPGMLDEHRAVHVAVSGQTGIAVSTGGNSIRIWNYDTGQVIRTIPIPKWSCHGLVVHSDGKQFAFISAGKVYLYDTSTGTQIANWQETGAQRLAYDPTGKRLAVAIQHDISGELRVYDAATQQLVVKHEIQPENFSLMTTGWGLVSIAFTPDGKRLIAGGNVGAALVFDSQSGEPVMELAGHSATIMSVAASPDGKRFATASYDNTVRLWDATTGQLVHTFRDHTKPIIDVAFSPDGKSLVAGGQDGIVRVWKSGL